ncbi:helix-turn-helix transcriptional regulator [Rubritalea marina]|uniref:helix-turn-helix transcriptional regulator n=1 Tax=Rubritalea marina TaxID=361055 RepID=UPI00039C2752|nr:winged helix-turn-helix transcriptional regulator [Rubritalea marina]
MFNDAYRDLTRPNVLRIIECLKKSQGMTVTALSKELEMSYMGVKQQCEKLETAGYLSTWRVPRKAAGRPEKLYLLTQKCDALFPQAGVELSINVMEGVKRFFGESAPEKILFHHFEQQRASWAGQVGRGKSLVEKATRLVELREKAGVFCRCHYSREDGFRIEEFHHPMQELFVIYPSAIRQEIRMMEQLLGTKVERTLVQQEKGGELVVYRIGVLG